MKLNNGLIKAYSRTSGNLIGVWPLTLEKTSYGKYTISAPVIGDVFAEAKFYGSPEDATKALRGGNEWLRIEVEWTK